MRIFAPGFGAGAVGGYVVMRVDPAIVSFSSQERSKDMENSNGHGNGRNGAASLEGKVALVTGASRGIGRAIALELARRGANVAIDFRVDTTHAQSVAEEVRALGVECLLLQGDISKKEDARRIVQEVLDKWQRLDVLVNNAGISRDHSMRKMTDEDWADVINVNLNGTFYCTSAALPAMINQRFGRIINISSVVGQMGAFGQANYSASKGGIIAFTKTLALEMARYNITANSIAPGYTSTEMVEAIPEELAAQIKAKIPLGRFASPEEIAKAAGFLAVDADYITGQELNVNGGCHM
jgi:3-oxoacyl-(acyl-carrier-protein) reductase